MDDENRRWWVCRCNQCGKLLSVTDATGLTAPPATPVTTLDNHFVERHGGLGAPFVLIVYSPTKENIL